MRGFDWSKRPDITARILEVYRGRLLQETTDIINGEFGTSFRSCQIRGYLQNRGLKTGLGRSKKGITSISGAIAKNGDLMLKAVRLDETTAASSIMDDRTAALLCLDN